MCVSVDTWSVTSNGDIVWHIFCLIATHGQLMATEIQKQV